MARKPSTKPGPDPTTPAKVRQGLRAGGAPGAAWPIARLMAADGDSDEAIARAIGVSDEAVRKRRHAEGWESPRDTPDPDPDTPADPSIRSLAVAAVGAMHPSAATKLIDEDSLAVLLTALTAGCNPHLAARAAGLDHDTLKSEAARCPQLATAVRIAAARSVSDKITRIAQAGERGDWKADAYLLERLPESKEQFAPKPAASQGGITVILNFDRDQLATQLDGDTIDGEAEEV